MRNLPAQRWLPRTGLALESKRNPKPVLRSTCHAPSSTSSLAAPRLSLRAVRRCATPVVASTGAGGAAARLASCGSHRLARRRASGPAARRGRRCARDAAASRRAGARGLQAAPPFGVNWKASTWWRLLARCASTSADETNTSYIKVPRPCRLRPRKSTTSRRDLPPRDDARFQHAKQLRPRAWRTDAVGLSDGARATRTRLAAALQPRHRGQRW